MKKKSIRDTPVIVIPKGYTIKSHVVWAVTTDIQILCS